jgi:hypothetical protein
LCGGCYRAYIHHPATPHKRKLNNEELHDLSSSPSIIKIMKARSMRWAGHVARMGEKRNAYRLMESRKEGRKEGGH